MSNAILLTIGISAYVIVSALILWALNRLIFHRRSVS